MRGQGCAGLPSSRSEAEEFIGRAMEQGDFGDAGGRLLLEEGLRGQELSYIVPDRWRSFHPDDSDFAITSGRSITTLGPIQAVWGAYSTDDILAPELEEEIVDNRGGSPRCAAFRRTGSLPRFSLLWIDAHSGRTQDSRIQLPPGRFLKRRRSSCGRILILRRHASPPFVGIWRHSTPNGLLVRARAS